MRIGYNLCNTLPIYGNELFLLVSLPTTVLQKIYSVTCKEKKSNYAEKFDMKHHVNWTDYFSLHIHMVLNTYIDIYVYVIWEMRLFIYIKPYFETKLSISVF